MTESTVVLVILLLAAVAFGIYLAAFIRGDGIRFERTDPPRSHHPYFDSTAGLA